MQYTIRKIPPQVDKALREKAKRENRSLNEVAVEALAAGVGVHRRGTRHRDLDFLKGTWVHDPGFDEAVAGMRRILPEEWPGLDVSGGDPPLDGTTRRDKSKDMPR